MIDEQIIDFQRIGIITNTNLGAVVDPEFDPSWAVKGDLSYQYATIGFILKAPWPYLLKPFYGIGLSNETMNIDLYFYKNGTTVSFYKTNISSLALIRFSGLEILSFEDLLFDNDNLIIGKATWILYDTISIEGRNGIKQDLTREKKIVEYASWSFTF